MQADTINQINKSEFDVASLAGAIIGFTLVVGTITIGTTNYSSFFNLDGLMIVVGGSLAVAFMSFQSDYVIEALEAIILMFKRPEVTYDHLSEDMIQLITWTYVVHSRGMLALEKEVSDTVEDPFLKYGLDLVVTGYSPQDVRAMMETAAEAAYERSVIPAQVLRAMASHAPAFGMVGTLVGMVVMLGSFKSDLSHIGEGLALSLLATLYGLITARMLYMPAAEKLVQKQEIARFRHYLLMEGLAMLADNKSPHYVQDRLNSFLNPSNHYNIDSRVRRPNELPF